MIYLKKLSKQKSDLKELWEFLEISTPFPSKEASSWLMAFEASEIESAITELGKHQDKVGDPVKYVGKILHNSKLQNMTVEQRAEKLSAMRALVGAVGGRRKHEAEAAQIRQQFATVCQSLPKVTCFWTHPFPLRF